LQRVCSAILIADKGIAPQDIIQARLAEDMLPFAYQVKSTAELAWRHRRRAQGRLLSRYDATPGEFRGAQGANR
jgi:hypothetical protein